MIIQDYVLCGLYITQLIIYQFTLCHKSYHRGLISLFALALLTETIWCTLLATFRLFEQNGQNLINVTSVNDSKAFASVQYNCQFIHIIAIYLFILFLLIVAKGWPITRLKMPFKYAFATFWLLCLGADLISFYWTTISNNLNGVSSSANLVVNQSTSVTIPKSDNEIKADAPVLNVTAETNRSKINDYPQITFDNFDSTPHKLSLLLRVVIMVYFLLELRTTMILEQEKKKLQFYLNFGALTMVWLVNTLIVYFISLRVDANWRNGLVLGCSQAADFIGFAMTTRLLWPKNPRSYLFRKPGHNRPCDLSNYSVERCEIDNYSTIDRDQNYLEDSEHLRNRGDDYGLNYDGLEMRDLNKAESGRD